MNCQFSPLALVAILAVLAGGCGSRGEQPTTSSRAPTAATPAQAADSERIKAENEWLKEELERIRGEKNALEQEVASLKAQVAQGSARTPSAPRLGSAAGLPGEPMPGDISVPKAPPGPLVFEHSLATSDALDKMLCSNGQYGGSAMVLPEGVLRVFGAHTSTAVWPQVAVQPPYRVEFEAYMFEHGWPFWILSGPGYGNNRDVSYCCGLDGKSLTLLKDGETLSRVELPEPVPFETWFTVQADVLKDMLTVAINGNRTIQVPLSDPVVGPLHRFIALGSFGGHLKIGTRYRNLRMWAAEQEQDSQLCLDPPPGEGPRVNGELLYEMKPDGEPLDPDWWCSQPEALGLEGGTVVLSRVNSAPELVLKKPFEGDLAYEIEMDYPTAEAVNFSMMLWTAPAPPIERDNRIGWLLWLPDGNGNTTIQWHNGKPDLSTDGWRSKSAPLARASYFAPLAERKYLFRLESVADELRLFRDGLLLLKTNRPPTAKLAGKTYIGAGQVFGASRVHAVRVYRLSSDSAKSQ